MIMLKTSCHRTWGTFEYKMGTASLDLFHLFHSSEYCNNLRKLVCQAALLGLSAAVAAPSRSEAFEVAQLLHMSLQ